MKTRTWIALAGIALALIVTIALAPRVLAQGPGGGYGPYGSGAVMGRMMGGGGGMGMRRGMGPIGGMAGLMGGPAQSLVAVAADTLVIPQADLIAQLQQGRTIAQVAAEHNVAPATIVDAFVATRQTRMVAAVADGRLTQEQADTMLATMRANVTARLSQPWSPQGNGPSAGFIDQDGDGVCDYAGSGRMSGGPMGGRGNQ